MAMTLASPGMLTPVIVNNSLDTNGGFGIVALPPGVNKISYDIVYSGGNPATININIETSNDAIDWTNLANNTTTVHQSGVRINEEFIAKFLRMIVTTVGGGAGMTLNTFILCHSKGR